MFSLKTILFSLVFVQSLFIEESSSLALGEQNSTTIKTNHQSAIQFNQLLLGVKSFALASNKENITASDISTGSRPYYSSSTGNCVHCTSDFEQECWNNPSKTKYQQSCKNHDKGCFKTIVDGEIFRGCVSDFMSLFDSDGFRRRCDELPDELCSICYGENCNSANIKTFSSMLAILVALLVARSGF